MNMYIYYHASVVNVFKTLPLTPNYPYHYIQSAVSTNIVTNYHCLIECKKPSVPNKMNCYRMAALVKSTVVKGPTLLFMLVSISHRNSSRMLMMLVPTQLGLSLIHDSIQEILVDCGNQVSLHSKALHC